MATISHNDIAKAIYISTRDKHGPAMHEAVLNIVKMLARKNLISKSKVILESLQSLVNLEDGTVEAKIWSSHRLSPESKKQITHALREKYGKKDFIFTENIDENLLGGFKIKVGDELLDLTIKNKIKKLQEHLNSHE